MKVIQYPIDIIVTHFECQEIVMEILSKLTEKQTDLVVIFFRTKEVNITKNLHSLSSLRKVIDFADTVGDPTLDFYIKAMSGVNAAAEKDIDFWRYFSRENTINPGLNPRINKIISGEQLPWKKRMCAKQQ